MNKIVCAIILILVIVSSSTSYAQNPDIGNFPYWESKVDKTGQTVDVVAEDHIKLYFDGTNFAYKPVVNSGGSKNLHLKLSKLSYPETDLTPVVPFLRDDISLRPYKNLQVGTVGGSANITSNGAATYTIPIKAVPGTNGATPKIGLVYNSNAGNGLLGWGWSLSGLSSISRIGKDKYHDTYYDKVHLDNTDKLTLDGVRLMLANNATEGNSNAIYAPEVGNSVRVFPHGATSKGYSWFEAQEIDGSKTEYGNSVTSKLENENVDNTRYPRFAIENGILSWLVNKVTDVNGNYTTYEYGRNSGEIFIKSISYTGNDAAGLSPYAKIEFNYQKRPDKNSTYMEGIEFNQTIVLTEIVVTYRNQMVSKYVLDYIDDTGYSQLNRITEYDKNNLRYNSTVFEYSAQNNNGKISAIKLETPFPESTIYELAEWPQLFGDFNGDKITDRILFGANNNSTIDWYMQFGKYFGKAEAGGFTSTGDHERQNKYDFVDPPSPNQRYQFTTNMMSFPDNEKLLKKQIQIVDINGDGFDDIILPFLVGFDDSFGDEGEGEEPPHEDRYHKLKIRIYTSDGSKLNYATEFTAIEERLFTVPSTWCDISVDRMITREELLVGDYDGDGYLELIIQATQFDMFTTPWPACDETYSNNWHFHKFYYMNLSNVVNGVGTINTNVTSDNKIFQSQENDEWYNVNAQAFPINYNGNRKTDLMFITDGCGTEENTGFYEYNELTNSLEVINKNKKEVFAANYYYYPGDFNGDGLTDLLYFTHSNGEEWKVRYGLDGDFSEPYTIPDFPTDPPPVTGTAAGDKSVPLVVDLNGDGKSDILWFENEVNNVYNPATNYDFFMSIGKGKFKHTTQHFTGPEWNISNNNLVELARHKTTKLIDFNGDGNVDFFKLVTSVWNSDYSAYILTFNFEDNGLHLENIYDGFNNKTTFAYAPLSKGVNIAGNADPYKKGTTSTYPIKDVRGGGYVATSIKKFSNDDHNTTTRFEADYQYEGGLIHTEGKGFLGFLRVTETVNEPDFVGSFFNTTKYINVNELKSDKYDLINKSSSIYDKDNTLLSQTILTNDRKDLSASRYFYHPSSLETHNYLNATTSKVVNEIDEWNNNLKQTITIGETNSPTMTIVTDNIYLNINTEIGSWCTNNKLTKTTIQQQHKDDTGTNTSEVLLGYSGASDHYRLTNVVSNPASNSKRVETWYTYDIFGNNVKTSYLQSVSGVQQNRYTDYIYDNLGQFPIATVNSLGHREAFNYDPKNGNLISYIDVDGNKISYDYDGFNRAFNKKTFLALNSSSSSNTDVNLRWTNSGDPAGTCYTMEVSGDNIPPAKAYFDSWGRNIISQQDSYYPNKTILVKKDYRYDGRIARIYKPADKFYFPTGNPQKYTEYSYDIYGRPTIIKDYDIGTELLTTYSYGNSNGYTQSVTTPDGGTTMARIDAAGFPYEIEDRGHNKIHYKYHNNGKVRLINTVGLDKPEALQVEMQYDEFGNQIKLIDKDAGTHEYEYNAFGELTKETNPTGSTEYSYDILGRVTSKKFIYPSPSTKTTRSVYNYIPSGNGAGQLSSIITTNGINKYYSYDQQGRVVKTVANVNGKPFEYNYTYNSSDFLTDVKFPSGIITNDIYDSHGYQIQSKRTDITPNPLLFDLKTLDEQERLVKYQTSNGKLTTQYTYDGQDYLTKLKTYKTSTPNNPIQELDVDYWRGANENGLIKRRHDVVNNQTELYNYDNHYRLKDYTTTNENSGLSSTVTMAYHDDGSIKAKTGATGTEYYFYNTDNTHRGDIQEPAHAVKGISPVTGVTPTQNITYTPFNSIESIVEGDKEAHFYYGDDEQRKKMEYKVNGVLQYTKYYLAGYELVEKPDGTKKEITYIDGSTVVVKEGTVEKTYCIQTDNLGSIQGLTLTDENGEVISGTEFSFDPWGNLRNPANWTVNFPNEFSSPNFGILGRGFTGHEHMSEFGLINMNGRVYDRKIGQFIQPDNFIQNPSSSQSYNRYSYCGNNPVNYTDPSGEIFGIDDALFIGLMISATTISYNTAFNWHTYGQAAGINTLATGVIYAIAGYGIGEIAGAGLNELGIGNLFGGGASSDQITMFSDGALKGSSNSVPPVGLNLSPVVKFAIKSAPAVGVAAGPTIGEKLIGAGKTVLKAGEDFAKGVVVGYVKDFLPPLPPGVTLNVGEKTPAYYVGESTTHAVALVASAVTIADGAGKVGGGLSLEVVEVAGTGGLALPVVTVVNGAVVLAGAAEVGAGLVLGARVIDNIQNMYSDGNGGGNTPNQNRPNQNTPNNNNTPVQYKKRISGKGKSKKSGKEKASDAPSWAKDFKPMVGESGDKFARRILNGKYGEGNYSDKTNTEYSRIVKWAERSFE